MTWTSFQRDTGPQKRRTLPQEKQRMGMIMLARCELCATDGGGRSRGGGTWRRLSWRLFALTALVLARLHGRQKLHPKFLCDKIAIPLSISLRPCLLVAPDGHGALGKASRAQTQSGPASPITEQAEERELRAAGEIGNEEETHKDKRSEPALVSRGPLQSQGRPVEPLSAHRWMVSASGSHLFIG